MMLTKAQAFSVYIKDDANSVRCCFLCKDHDASALHMINCQKFSESLNDSVLQFVSYVNSNTWNDKRVREIVVADKLSQNLVVHLVQEYCTLLRKEEMVMLSLLNDELHQGFEDFQIYNKDT